MRDYIRQLVAVLAAAVLVLSIGGCGFIKITNNAVNANSPAADSADASGGGGRGTASGGVSDETGKAQNPKAMEILEQGYSIIERDGDHYISYGLIIKNPNAQDLAYPGLKITVRDKDNKVLESSSILCHGVGGNETVGVGGYTLITSGRPTKAEFSTERPSEYNVYDSGILKTTDVLIFNTSHVSDEYSSRITGDITNKSKQEYEGVQLNIIFRDSAGKIVGGAQGGLDILAADATIPFDIYLSRDSTPTGFKDFELFAAGNTI